MNRKEIKAAFDRAAPNRQIVDGIYKNILQASSSAVEATRSGGVLRRMALAAACVAALALLATAGYAAYQRWHLPEPEVYQPDEQGWIYREHTRADYTVPEDTDLPSSSDAPSAVDPLSDEALMARSVEILQEAGMDGVKPDAMTVIRQKNLYWDREEAEVSFLYNDLQTSLKFDAETGVLIGMAGIEWVLDDVHACRTQAEADALAQRYYESLPVEQGYEMRHVEKYDDQFWSYDFCREVRPGLYSEYECVRISINPVSGRLTALTVFYVPLLDDHQPEDAPLTQAEAEEAALACPELYLKRDGYVLKNAEIRVGMPNWMFTAHSSVHAKASAVTRLCWYLVYERPDSQFADKIFLLVDLYTGEILGGDVTG